MVSRYEAEDCGDDGITELKDKDFRLKIQLQIVSDKRDWQVELFPDIVKHSYQGDFFVICA